MKKCEMSKKPIVISLVGAKLTAGNKLLKNKAQNIAR
jgi:hypothetical protein